MDDDDDLFGVFDLEGVAATGTSNAPTAAPAAATPSAPRTGCASSAEPPGGVASASATPPPTPSGNGSSTSPRPPPPDNSTPTATADSAAAASAAAAATGAKPLPLPLVLSVSFSQHPLARRARAQVLAAIEQALSDTATTDDRAALAKDSAGAEAEVSAAQDTVLFYPHGLVVDPGGAGHGSAGVLPTTPQVRPAAASPAPTAGLGHGIGLLASSTRTPRTPTSSSSVAVPSAQTPVYDAMPATAVVGASADEALDAIRTGRACFNCTSTDHELASCPDPINHQVVEANKDIFFQSRRHHGPVSRGRYHTAAHRTEHLASLRPGQPSLALRHALDMRPGELPPYIARMQRIGYPPGWQGPHGGSIDGDSSAPLMLFGGANDSSAQEPGAADAADASKEWAVFPGFNAPFSASADVAEVRRLVNEARPGDPATEAMQAALEAHDRHAPLRPVPANADGTGKAPEASSPAPRIISESLQKRLDHLRKAYAPGPQRGSFEVLDMDMDSDDEAAAARCPDPHDHGEMVGEAAPLLTYEEKQELAEQLAEAVAAGDADAARALLVAKHADPNVADSRAQLPLHTAAARNDGPMAELLLGQGAFINAPAPASGDTALHVCLRQGHTDLGARLQELGADPGKANTAGQLPRDVAAVNASPQLTQGQEPEL